MRPRRQYRLLQAAFVFALVGVAFWGSYIGYRASDYPAQAKTDQHAQGIDYPSAIWHWLAHDAAGFFTAGLCVVTGLLAWFTYALYKTTSQLATETREASAAALDASTTATNLARDEFNATHRPKISVRGFTTLEEGDELSISFVYVNSGIGTATVTDVYCALVLGEIRRTPGFEPTKIPNTILRSGDSELFRFRPHNAVEFAMGRGFSARDDDNPSGHVAYLVGSVVYQDSSGRRRETGFCRKNDLGSDRWVLVANSEYDYED